MRALNFAVPPGSVDPLPLKVDPSLFKVDPLPPKVDPPPLKVDPPPLKVDPSLFKVDPLPPKVDPVLCFLWQPQRPLATWRLESQLPMAPRPSQLPKSFNSFNNRLKPRIPPTEHLSILIRDLRML
ncbi:hypothetical protein JX266_012086 [Neoarthrinium moseri]|nr:hypothetical protein JX266_012086 [Neoarthrinium moseri]